MPFPLAKILAAKKKELAVLKKNGLPLSGADPLPPVRDFKKALSTPGQTVLIAEIKFASPSAGAIRAREDPPQYLHWLCGGRGSGHIPGYGHAFLRGKRGGSPAIKEGHSDPRSA
jgi:hypothetical protein